jgi:hypothetical protein
VCVVVILKLKEEKKRDPRLLLSENKANMEKPNHSNIKIEQQELI